MESRQARIDRVVEKLRPILEPRIQHRKSLEEKLAAGEITDMYQYMESWLTCPTTGKILQDVVITAIQRLESPEHVRSFYEGYAADIAAHPEKYPAFARDDPDGYARSDIGWALGLHFRDKRYHDLWEKAILD